MHGWRLTYSHATGHPSENTDVVVMRADSAGLDDIEGRSGGDSKALRSKPLNPKSETPKP